MLKPITIGAVAGLAGLAAHKALVWAEQDVRCGNCDHHGPAGVMLDTYRGPGYCPKCGSNGAV